MSFLLSIQLVAIVVALSHLPPEFSHVLNYSAQRLIDICAALQVYFPHEIFDFLTGGDSFASETTLCGVISGSGSLGKSPSTLNERSTGG